MNLYLLNNYLLLVNCDEILKDGYVLQIGENSKQIIKIESDSQRVIANCKNGSFTKYNILAYYPLSINSSVMDLPILPNPYKIDINKIELDRYNELNFKLEQAKKFNGQVAGRHPDLLTSREITANVSGYIDGILYNKFGSFTIDDILEAIEFGISLYDTSDRKMEVESYIKSITENNLPREFILSNEHTDIRNMIKYGKYKY